MTEEYGGERGRFIESIVDLSPNILYILDLAERRVVYANKGIHTVLGYSPDEVRTLGDQVIPTLIHPDDLPAYLGDTVPRYARGQDAERIVHQCRLRHKSGEWRWLDCTELVYRREPDGSPRQVLGVAHDITERIQAEEKLRKSESRLRESQEVAKIGSWSWDLVNSTLEWSDEAFRRFDKDPATFTPTVGYFVDLIHPDDRDAIRKAIEASLAHDAPYHIQPRIRNESGRAWSLEGFGRVERDADGRAVRFAGTVQDITERMEREEALRASEERFQLAMRGATDGLWDWNLSTDEVYYSPRWKSMLGYAPEELEPSIDTWKRLVHPDDRQRTLAVVRDLLEGRCDKFDVEFRMRHKDGGYRHILSRAFHFVSAERGLRRLVGTHVDITDRKRAEEKIRESEEFIRSILDTVDEGFLVIDRDYRVLTANKAYCDQVGGCEQGVVGRHCFELTHRLERPCFEAGEECGVRRVFADGKPHATIHRHKDAGGGLLYVEIKAFPIRDASGDVVSAIETINNITEKRLLEEERLKTQKLESIGTLAGGIAHDFNNLLQGVFGYIALARMTQDDPGRSRAMLEQAEKALHQSVNLTMQLLTFSKGGKPLRQPTALRPVIENAVRFALSGSQVDHRVALEGGLPAVMADAGQIGQVIQNIALNAVQAMPLGGTIEVSARSVRSPGPEAPPTLAHGDYVCLAIRDQGIGIPPEHQSRIFDPYFTTKEKGSGLGLATSYSIVRNHGGLIEVASELGRGSTFTLWIPVAEAVEPERTGEAPVEAGFAVRLLLMDDEEVIRNVAAELLAELGHTVVLASRGEDALEAYEAARAEGRPFDAVILDVTVRGGLGGLETARRLREIDPDVRAVVSSGYADDASLASCREQGFRAMLKKPYHIDELRDVLNGVLG